MIVPSVAAAIEPAGYAHERYARALAEFGTPRFLPRSGGWVLERAIAGSHRRDAMGCYPLFACLDWSRLAEDLEELRDSGLVSITLVADPFGAFEAVRSSGAFDPCRPFKDHLIVDLDRPPESYVSKHHRYYARRAIQGLEVERTERPETFVDEWTGLYAALVGRHDLHGIHAFSRCSLEQQLMVPGAVMFRAVQAGEVVAAHVWYQFGEVAYSHLAAQSEAGYAASASYALYWEAIHSFRNSFDRPIRRLDLGGAPGVDADGSGGLLWFKRGWANATAPTWFVGRIVDPEAYRELVERSGVAANGYFPAYRQGEFGR